MNASCQPPELVAAASAVEAEAVSLQLGLCTSVPRMYAVGSSQDRPGEGYSQDLSAGVAPCRKS